MNGIPFFSLEHQHTKIKGELENAFAQSLVRNEFILGQELKVFEHAFAKYSGSKFCAGVGNGLDAIYLSLRALQVGVGDEVLVPSHTCHATWLAVSRTGARPVPVEVNEKTMVMDMGAFNQLKTSKTKAAIPVHLYGFPCNMKEIMEWAETQGIFIVEDNAQAHGAMSFGRRTGSWGHISATSFYPTKNLGALGDGGAVTTSDETLWRHVCAERNYGAIAKDVHEQLGINSRLDDWQATVLSLKLANLERWNAQRVAIATAYSEALAGVGDLLLPPSGDENSRPVFHQYIVRTRYRNTLKEALAKQGIGTAIHYPTPIHLQLAYKKLGFGKGTLPVAEGLASSVLSLPIWPGLSAAQTEEIINTIKQFFHHL